MAITKKRYSALVTGGAGFIGSTLAQRLDQLGHQVTVIDDLSRGHRANVPKGAAFHKLGLLSPKLSEVVAAAKPDVVFHLAAHINVRVSVERPEHDAEINLVGGLNLLKASMAAKAKKFVFSSSGGAMYNNPPQWPAREGDADTPLSPYGVAKRAFEMYLESFAATRGLDFAALRYANVYGPRQDTAGEAGVVAIFIEKLLAGEPLKVFGDGEQTRDFVYVDDVVAANLKAACSCCCNLVANVGTGEETSVNRVAELVARAIGGKKPRIRRFKAIAGELRRSALDPSFALEAIGWQPTVGIEDGIKRTVAWFQAKR
jgi:UDP-glucose 4-epimerase